MLGQVELGKTTPSIHVVWKIAQSLGVTFAMLVDGIAETGPIVLRASSAKRVTSKNGEITARALFPVGTQSSVEFYELCIAPGCIEKAEPHPPTTRENLVVLRGMLGILICGERHSLAAGDAIEFQADVAHEYCNEGDGVLQLYVVMTRRPEGATAGGVLMPP